MGMLMEVTKAVRHIRSEMNVPPGKQVEAFLEVPQNASREVLERGTGYVQSLANAKVAIYDALPEKPEQAAHAVTRGVEVFVPLKGLIDIEQEAARLRKELAGLEKDLARVKGKLNNQGFLSKAPADVIEKERKKEDELTGKQTAIRERLSMLVGKNE
ncbi:MAG: Valine--tRNA ligase [Pelotomaculum sp. PtaB.Bin013]|nr:MAG: Valine--tRNA ligase [Pelotomaculum sp. PtaB.Bin013]